MPHRVSATAGIVHAPVDGRMMRNNTLISVVDDDKSSRIGVARLVRSMGYHALAFRSAPEFLASPHFGETACLIADIWMPDMTGTQLHLHLRFRGYDIPTILITGYPEEVAKVQAVARGVVCYLGKPFAEAELVHCLHLALGNGNSR